MTMKLRELINRLEKISDNGRYDDMDVHAISEYDLGYNEPGDVVKGAVIARFVRPNDEYDFVGIITE